VEGFLANLTNTVARRIQWGECDPAGIVFYPRYFGETAFKLLRYWQVYRKCKSILAEVKSAPMRLKYNFS
jgi:hypothetical protein